MMKLRILVLLIVAGFGCAAHAALGVVQAELNKPQAPFKIIGDIYYVGTNDVGIYLITTPKGSILLDSGFLEPGPRCGPTSLPWGSSWRT